MRVGRGWSEGPAPGDAADPIRSRARMAPRRNADAPEPFVGGSLPVVRPGVRVPRPARRRLSAAGPPPPVLRRAPRLPPARAARPALPPEVPPMLQVRDVRKGYDGRTVV